MLILTTMIMGDYDDYDGDACVVDDGGDCLVMMMMFCCW